MAFSQVVRKASRPANNKDEIININRFQATILYRDCGTDGLSGYHLAGIQYLPHFRWGISRSKGACLESRGTFYSLARSPCPASNPSKGPRFPENHKDLPAFTSPLQMRLSSYRIDFHNHVCVKYRVAIFAETFIDYFIRSGSKHSRLNHRTKIIFLRE